MQVLIGKAYWTSRYCSTDVRLTADLRRITCIESVTQVGLFDVNDFSGQCELSLVPRLPSWLARRPYISPKARLRPSDGPLAAAHLASLRPALRRQPSRSLVLLPGPIPVRGLRADHRPSQLARSRDLLARPAQQALPHGHPRRDCPLHAGRRQCSARLEDLAGLCPGPDPHRSAAVPRRRPRPGPRQYGLRARLLDHLSEPKRLLAGPLPSHQRSRQDPHLDGLAGQHPDLRADHRRQAARRQGAG